MILDNEVFIVYDDVKNECIASFFTGEDYRIDNNVSIKGKLALLMQCCNIFARNITTAFLVRLNIERAMVVL